MAVNKSMIVKIMELAVVCTLIGLHYHSFSDKGQNSAMIVMGTFGGYLIILVGIFAGIVMGNVIERRMDMFFSVVGCILFTVAGALIIDHFSNSYHSGSLRDTGLAKGCISIVEGIIFLVDAVLMLRGEA